MLRRDCAAFAGRVALIDDDDDAGSSGAVILKSAAPRSVESWGMSLPNTRLKSRAQLISHAPNWAPTNAV